MENIKELETQGDTSKEFFLIRQQKPSKMQESNRKVAPDCSKLVMKCAKFDFGISTFWSDGRASASRSTPSPWTRLI